jgi:mannose-6-phosphate isomerase-like protein (cupin superfamily)
VLSGSIRIFLQDPKEDVRLTPGQTFTAPPKRPHLVTNAGDTSAVFFVLQGNGEYDFIPLT